MAETALDLLIRAKDMASGPLKNVAGSIDKADKSTSNWQSSLTKIGIGMTAVGAGLTLFAKKATDTTIEFATGAVKMSREIGVSVTEASRLQFAAKYMGLSTQQASLAFGNLSKQIALANDRTGQHSVKQNELRVKIKQTEQEIGKLRDEERLHGDSTGELNNKIEKLQVSLSKYKQQLSETQGPLAKLHINTKNADGSNKSFSQILFEVSDRFKNMPNGVDKTTLAMQLFGRSGKDLIPLLNQGSEGIKALEAEADKLGVTLTGDNVKAFEEYVRATKELKAAQLGLEMQIGKATIPVLADFNKKVSEALQWLLKLPEPFHGVAVAAAAFGGPVLTAAGSLLTIAANIANILPMMKQLKSIGKVTLSVGLVGTEVAVAISLIVEEYGKLQKEVEKLRDSAQSGQVQVDQLNKRIAESKTQEEADKWRKLRDEQQRSNDETQKAADKFSGLSGVWEGFKIMIEDNILKPLSMVGPAIGAFLGNLWSQISTFFSNIWADVTGWVSRTVNDVVNWFAQLPGRVGQWLSNLVAGIGRWFSNAWSSAVNWAGRLVNGVVNWISQLPGRAANWISNMAGRIASGIGNAASRAASGASNLVSRVIGFIGSLPGRAARAIGGLGGAIAGVISGAAGAAYRAASNIGRSIINAIKDHIPGPLKKFIPGLAAGGVVKGFAGGGRVGYHQDGYAVPNFSPRGTDTVPAMLTPGEGIITRPAMNAIGEGVLSYINRHRRLPPSGDGVTINQTNHIYQQADLDVANRELGWRIATA